jgi:hypothetical protein
MLCFLTKAGEIFRGGDSDGRLHKETETLLGNVDQGSGKALDPEFSVGGKGAIQRHGGDEHFESR